MTHTIGDFTKKEIAHEYQIEIEDFIKEYTPFAEGEEGYQRIFDGLVNILIVATNYTEETSIEWARSNPHY